MASASLYGFGKKGPYQPRPLYNLGAPRSGGRFPPRGGAPSLYLAEDFDTSIREFLQVSTGAPAPRPEQPAFVTFVVNVSLCSVLDLTHAKTRELLETTPAELASPWRYRRDRRVPPTQRLGRAAVATGLIEGIRFESSKGSGCCLVVFTDALRAPSRVDVFDPDSKLTVSARRPTSHRYAVGPESARERY